MNAVAIKPKRNEGKKMGCIVRVYETVFQARVHKQIVSKGHHRSR